MKFKKFKIIYLILFDLLTASLTDLYDMNTSIPRSSNNVISSSVYQTTPKNQTANLNVDSNHETSSIFQTTPKNQTANLNLDSIHETSSINHTTHRSLPINILSNLSDSTLASPLPSTSRDLSSSFIINGKILYFKLIKFLHHLHIYLTCFNYLYDF